VCSSVKRSVTVDRILSGTRLLVVLADRSHQEDVICILNNTCMEKTKTILLLLLLFLVPSLHIILPSYSPFTYPSVLRHFPFSLYCFSVASCSFFVFCVL